MRLLPGGTAALHFRRTLQEHNRLHQRFRPFRRIRFHQLHFHHEMNLHTTLIGKAVYLRKKRVLFKGLRTSLNTDLVGFSIFASLLDCW